LIAVAGQPHVVQILGIRRRVCHICSL
jgi:hypothetical protein